MRISFAFIILISLISCSYSHHLSDHTTATEFQFTPSESTMQAIDSKLEKAKSAQQQLLLVLGANWCHDSQGLIQRFSNDKMTKLLHSNYQTLFIDIGYYQKGFDVVKRFGMPIYYGTPTVMIIDPNSNKITNLDSMQQWLNADSIELQVYLDYFTKAANASNNQEYQQSQQFSAYKQQIAEFSLHHAKRLKKAYEILGPALQRFVEEKIAFTEQEEALWSQARTLRYNIQNDVIALQKQAQEAISTNQSIQLNFPSYSAFAWEESPMLP